MPVEEKWSPGSRQEKAQFAREAAVNRGDVSQETWDVWQELNSGQAVNPENLTQSGKDYYSQLETATEKQQPVYQAPSYVQTVSGANREVQQPQDEQERKSVVVNRDNILSPKERLEQEEKSYFDQMNEQPKLKPQVITDDIDAIMKQYEEWQNNREERGLDPERERRFTNMDTGEDLTNPLDWNILGFTSQQKTPTAVKNIYDYYFAQEDANPITPHDHDRWDERRGTWGRDLDVMPNYIRNMPVYVEGMNGPEVMNFGDSQALNDWWSRPVVGENAIDNGLSPESRESIYMTGRRYLDYVTKYGLPGRDPNEIDPNAIYSKQDEMENYGFIPYLTDKGIGRFHDDAAANAVNNAIGNLADFRRDNTNYSYNYDGNTYDGKDFDRKYNLWLNTQNTTSRQPVRDESRANENSVPLGMYMTDSKGNIHYPPNKGVFTYDPETGQPMVDFQTGDPNDNWYFDDTDDFNRSLHYEELNENNPVIAAWDNQEPLVLEDGQVIRADKARDLYRNKEQYADYGMFNWSKPAVEDPLQDFTSGEIVPWFVDMALGSAPLFFGPSAAAQAIGGAYSNWSGFKPGAQTSNGEYKLLSDNPTHEEQLWSSTGSAILPATERLWGIAGNAAKFPGEKILSRRNPNAVNHPAYNIVSNALGEGVEEIPGNLVEEMQGAGTLSDYFANPYYYQLDENGNVLRDENGEALYTTENTGSPIFDKQGKQIRDPNTSFFDRLGNFWADAPLSMLGGALLGGLLGAPSSLASYGKYKQARDEADDEYQKYGYNLFIPEEVEDYYKRQAGE